MYGQEYQIATTAIIPPQSLVTAKSSSKLPTVSSQVSDPVPVGVDGTQGSPAPLGNLQIGKVLFVGPSGTLTQDFDFVKENCRWIVAAGRATAKDMFIFEPHVPMDQTGGGGPSIGGYTHVQTVASATWTIVHNLGRYVNVEVYDVDGDSVVRDLTHIDLNSCTVRLVVATTGHAACV